MSYVMRKMPNEMNSEMPVSWRLIENCSGEVLRRSKNRVLVAGWRRVIGATVVPVFKREAKKKK
jgi:hypothetical protein